MSGSSARPVIAVLGTASPTGLESAWAEEVGRGIARRGGILLCGGLSGVMEAAARGAKAEGGLTVGILPGTDPRAANPFIDVRLPTGLGDARNVLVASGGEAAIAVSGRAGTLSEIAFALLRGRPVVALGSWTLDAARLPGGQFHTASSPEEAVNLAFQLIGRG